MCLLLRDGSASNEVLHVRRVLNVPRHPLHAPAFLAFRPAVRPPRRWRARPGRPVQQAKSPSCLLLDQSLLCQSSHGKVDFLRTRNTRLSSAYI